MTYVLNLAVADFCFLITGPLKIAQDIKTKWIAGEFMCHFAGGFVTYLNFLVSGYIFQKIRNYLPGTAHRCDRC